jgi:hypothetical protein
MSVQTLMQSVMASGLIHASDTASYMLVVAMEVRSPKDVQALERTAQEYSLNLQILQAVEAVNNQQKQVLGNKITQRFGKI